ncbi:MAG: M20/M25/M40 family metallo-hydrolase [Candidatus Zixiibacteriota bacterium]|nr:MAG: M20/M25/M40 family metallo-hydrolase [candidate division Zixibacteria bacterium]
MTCFRLFFVTLALTLFVFATASADDIVLLTVKNKMQAQVATGILGSAHTRADGRFLVSISAVQGELLKKAGLEFDPVLTEADPASTYLIYPQPQQRGPQLGMAGAVDIGMGLRLSRLSPEIEESLSGRGRLRVAALDKLEVSIFYAPKVIETLLSTLEDYPTDSLVDRISLDSIYAFDTHLEAFETRYIWTANIDAARDWMVQKFLDWGYTDVTTPTFSFGGGTHYNVKCVKPGFAEPDVVIVIGGHYDSIVYGQSPGPYEYAPGADDNASGTTVCLELARILADVPLRKTIVFMPFSAEEVGLVGSGAAARDFYNAGTNLEVMYNYDMVAHDPNNFFEINLSSGENIAYRTISYNAVNRVTTLTPFTVAMGSSSDHFPFYTHGFNIANCIERDFNDLGWHTNLDTSDRLNFPYFTEVVKMACASMAYVANSAHITDVEEIVDQGDGQSVEVFWTACDPSYTYTVRYGWISGVYPESFVAPPGACSYVIDGLTEGQTYYFSVVGEVPDAYPAAYTTEASAVSLVIPRTPVGLTAEPWIYEISLLWNSNREADISHYHVYRDDGSGFVLYMDNVTDTTFNDTGVEAVTEYTYRITAVDFDVNESTASPEVSAMAYTFDQGILLVDETADDWVLPNQQAQEAFFDSIFAGQTYAMEMVQGTSDSLTKQQAGPYSSIIWLDDDTGYKDAHYSENTLRWYTGFPTDLFMAGWKTITAWAESPIDPGHFVYEQFGVEGYTQNDLDDFCGAVGHNGWPSLVTDTDNTWSGNLPYIPALEVLPGATVIYTYDSFSDNPTFEGQPCGVIQETAGGKRVILAFPVFFLTPASSEAVIQKVISYFGEGSGYVFGDADSSGAVDALDIIYLVEYFWSGGPPPADLNAADVDGSCQVDTIDLVYLVDYVFASGPDPQAGCVE